MTLAESADIFGCHNCGNDWHQVSRGRGCRQTPRSAHDSPHRLIWPKLSVVPKLRNPALKQKKKKVKSYKWVTAQGLGTHSTSSHAEPGRPHLEGVT